MPEGNRMFAEMLRPARERLAGRCPEEIARKADTAFDGEVFAIPCLNEVLRLRWPELEFEGNVEGWLQLVVLHYLHLADGTPLSGQIIPFAMLRDGMVRGGGFERQCEAQLAEFLTGKTEEDMDRICAALGGRGVASNADFCGEFPFLPRYLLTLKLWFADEDFPASGRLFLDGSADHYLSVEDAVTVGDIFLRKLTEGGMKE